MALAMAATAVPPAPAAPPADHPVVGWVQNVALYPGGLILKAKMDSGARTASLHVERFARFTRDDRPWVRFAVAGAGGRSVVFERPVIRIARVKREDGGERRSPVVTLDLCIGRVKKRAEVGLNDRSGFNYPLLVGRSYLAGEFLIDPGRTFLSPPRCDHGN